MRADARENAPGMLLGKVNRCLARFNIDARHDQPPYTAGKSGGNHVLAVGGKLPHLHVTMGIYQHKERPSSTLLKESSVRTCNVV
jgi:hypothetical protein